MNNSTQKLLEDFLTHLRVDRGVSSRTLLNYRLDIERYLVFMAREHLDPLAATRKELMAYLWERKEQDSAEPASLARYVASLRAFYRFLALEDKITRDPAALLTTPRKPERLPKALTIDEVSSLITAAQGSGLASVRLRAMLEVMYGAGLRVSELTNIRRDQIDLRVGFVRVVGKGSKERIVPIGEKAKWAVQAWMDARPETPASVKALFISNRKTGMSPVQFWRLVQATARKAGIQKPVTPHVLRHSFASHLVQNGADLRVVQEMLGHASITTTQIYTHLERSHVQAAHKKFHPRA